MSKVNIANLLKRAEEALNRRNYDLAIFNYLQAVSIQPENVDARSKLRATQTRAIGENGGGSAFKATICRIKAQLFSSFKKYEQAIIACENGLTAQPSNVGLMALLADCANEAELIEVAAWQRQEIADKHDEENTENLYELAGLYQELGRGQEAINCYERMQKIDPDADVGQEIRNASAILTSDIYGQGAKTGSRDMLKNTEEAEILELLSGKMKTDDHRWQVINYRLAHDCVDRPNDHRVWMQIGEVCYDMDDWEQGYVKGKEFLNKALELNSSDSAIRDKLGDLEIKKLRTDMQALKAQVQADPKNAALVKKYKEQDKERVDYEVHEFERRVKDQPLKALFHYRLGALYFNTGRNDDAIGELQLAAKDPKYKIEALTMLGRAFHAMEQYDMAITQFNQAREGQELFTKIRDPFYYEGLSLEAKGDLESVRAALTIFTKLYQTDINFRDVKTKVPALQKTVKELGG